MKDLKDQHFRNRVNVRKLLSCRKDGCKKTKMETIGQTDASAKAKFIKAIEKTVIYAI